MEPADDVFDSSRMKLISSPSRSSAKAVSHDVSKEINKTKESKDLPMCSICYEHVKNYLECPNGSHFYCSSCFNVVSSLCFESVEQAFQAEGDMESLIARNGKIFCPDPECKSRRQHQIKGSDSSQKAFLDTQIVTHCASSVVAKYIHTVSYALSANRSHGKNTKLC